MRDSNTGIVTCERCEAVLGKYLTGDYFKLIRIKYCDNCKGTVRREYKRFWNSQHRQANKELNKEMREQIRLLKEENERLRAERFGTDTQMNNQKFKGLVAEMKSLKC